MRDFVEPPSQPAGPACCLRDCKLSLRMQTQRQDRNHLPILPSNTGAAVNMSPCSLSPPPSAAGIFLCLCPCTCMYMNSPPLREVFLLSLDEMSQLAACSPPHCSMVRCLSVGGRQRVFGFFCPCFTSLPV